MKKILLILILILSFQSWTNADDVRDFEIEGMSIGDSLLNYYSEEEINNATDESYKDKLFITKTMRTKNYNLYDIVQLTYKKSDEKKNLHTIVGVIDFSNNINKCKKEMKKIVSELSLLFPFAIKKDWGKYDMSEGHYFPVTFDFKDSSRAMAACFDWNKESGINDSLKVSLYTAEYRKYLEKQDQ
jgi:hypothetical protein